MTTESASSPWDIEEEERAQTALTVIDTNAIAQINRSEIESQLDAAHKYARSIKRFMSHSIGMATISVATAESCMYAVPRGGKTLCGPSVRLAEIMASCYGNLHIGARIVNIGEKEVTAQGIAWDLETNLRVSVEINRRISDKNGRRFNDDMIGVTCAAACSIALRNAVFRVVPRAFVDQVYEKCKDVAVGNAKTLVARRDDVLSRLARMGADGARVLKALGLHGVDDITLEHLEQLIGMGTAIKSGDKSVDELFPAVVATVPGADQPGRKVSLKFEAAEKPAKEPSAPVAGEDEKEPLAAAMARWTSDLHRAVTTSEIERVAREAKKRLDIEGPDYAEIVRLCAEYKSRLPGMSSKQKPAPSGPPPRTESDAPDREPGADDE